MALATRLTFAATLMCFVVFVSAGPVQRENSLSSLAGESEKSVSPAVNKPMNASSLGVNKLDKLAVNEPVKFSSTPLHKSHGATSVNKSTKSNSAISSIQFGRKLVPRARAHLNFTTNRLRSRYRQEKKHEETTKNIPNNCADEKNSRCLLSALSKIAKVRVADHSLLNSDRELRNTNSQKTDNKPLENEEARIIEASEKSEGKKLINTEEFQSESTRENPQTIESLDKLQKFHCHGIHEVYIPEVESLMPAYACIFGDRTFILSSPRFHQDQRSHLNVDVDGEVFQRLTETARIANDDFETKIISALLVLRTDEDDYRIQTSSDTLLE